MEKFTLTGVEQDGLVVEEEDVEEISIKGLHCLVGKLISERVIGKDAIRTAMKRGWKPRGTVSFKVLGENLFLVEFKDEWDKIRVLEGRPWSFERRLFSVVEYDGATPPEKLNFDTAAFWVRMYRLPLSCMSREIGYKLGATIGLVEEVDTDEDGVGWGEYLRVKARVNVFQPLPRGRILKLKNKTLWVEFQYEKIPQFCFNCGVICHGEGGCVNEVLRWKNGRGKVEEYGPWLRVGAPRRRQPMIRGRYGDDGNFHGSDSSPVMEGYRKAAQGSSNSNGRLNREDSRDGMSGFSGPNHRGVTDTFLNGENVMRKKDDMEMEVNESQGDTMSNLGNSLNEPPTRMEGGVADFSGLINNGKGGLSPDFIAPVGDFCGCIEESSSKAPAKEEVKNKEGEVFSKNLPFLGESNYSEAEGSKQIAEEVGMLAINAKGTTDVDFVSGGQCTHKQVEELRSRGTAKTKVMGQQGGKRVATWKKRARNATGGTETENMKLQKYGTRKAGVLEGDGKILKSKKKGKWVEVGNVQTDKAVAVEQPRQSL
jgi:hypothetical protein